MQHVLVQLARHAVRGHQRAATAAAAAVCIRLLCRGCSRHRSALLLLLGLGLAGTFRQLDLCALKACRVFALVEEHVGGVGALTVAGVAAGAAPPVAVQLQIAWVPGPHHLVVKDVPLAINHLSSLGAHTRPLLDIGVVVPSKGRTAVHHDALQLVQVVVARPLLLLLRRAHAGHACRAVLQCSQAICCVLEDVKRGRELKALANLVSGHVEVVVLESFEVDDQGLRQLLDAGALKRRDAATHLLAVVCVLPFHQLPRHIALQALL
mmetsp:Transcript_10567/g.22693  ORF Transcript_10567/g.22693 Transcript_10567/m.22693 type:complete len:266 (+) Transcript_10567:248-1045(+)